VSRWLLSCFAVLPFLALLAEQLLPGSAVAEGLDAWFSFHCHQAPDRTLRIAGNLLPVCARCTGLYVGLFLGALLQRPRGSQRSWGAVLGAATALLFVDVATQAAGLRVSSLVTRAVTGVLLAYPAARLATGGFTAPRA
jgi:uncharacterized membrane protein